MNIAKTNQPKFNYALVLKTLNAVEKCQKQHNISFHFFLDQDGVRAIIVGIVIFHFVVWACCCLLILK